MRVSERMRMRFFREIKGLKTIFLLVAGGAASTVFPPFTDNVWGYLSLFLFLGYLLLPIRTKKDLFYSAYVFGFSFFAIGFSWINNALLIDDDKFINYVPLVFFVIGAFFGLFWAIPAFMVSWGRTDQSRVLLFSSSYVLFEWVRSFIFTGFPWNLLGTALNFDSRLISGASYVGTYGLSLLILLGLGGLILIAGSKEGRKFGISLMFIVGTVFYLFSLNYVVNLKNSSNAVRLVQPNIAQTFKWNRELLYQNFRQYIDLSKIGVSKNIKMIVWGETATPYYLDRDISKLREITEAIPQGSFLITGLLRVGERYGQYLHYNSLFVIDDRGNIRDYYDKSHLVPFGEYLPFREYLPDFMAPVSDIVGELGRGEKYKNIRVEGLPLLGAAICYESIFPHDVLNQEQKPEILVVLANDGWYGISSGPYQHLAAAQMRAVEEGITVVRSANTGISAMIDFNGEIRGSIGLDKKGIADIYLPETLSRKTFYGSYGNVIPLILVLLTALFGFLINAISGCKKRLK